MVKTNNYRKLISFDEHVIRNVRKRQNGYCAYCNNKLNGLYVAGSRINAHHVIPVQAVEQHSHLANELIEFLRGPDNCVLLCSSSEENVGFGGCHLHAGHGGNYKTGAAPPSFFKNSHRRAQGDRIAWIARVETKWRLLFGQTSQSTASNLPKNP